MLTNKEIIDRVEKHLLSQGVKSFKEGRCSYRGLNNSSCAIGCLIPDELYHFSIEGLAIPNNNYNFVDSYSLGIKKFAEILSEIGITDNQLPLLQKLQAIHDCTEPDEWGKKLKALRKLYKDKPNYK